MKTMNMGPWLPGVGGILSMLLVSCGGEGIQEVPPSLAQTESRVELTPVPYDPVVPVPSYPDLIVEQVSCLRDATVVFKIKNQGTASAVASEAELTVGTTATRYSVPALAPGELVTFVSASLGSFAPAWGIRADVLNQNAEKSELNNAIVGNCPNHCL
jgi:CARDB